jgi:hypothetical protein
MFAHLELGFNVTLLLCFYVLMIHIKSTVPLLEVKGKGEGKVLPVL